MVPSHDNPATTLRHIFAWTAYGCAVLLVLFGMILSSFEINCGLGSPLLPVSLMAFGIWIVLIIPTLISETRGGRIAIVVAALIVIGLQAAARTDNRSCHNHASIGQTITPNVQTVMDQ
jgi:hypothetical protein